MKQSFTKSLLKPLKGIIPFILSLFISSFAVGQNQTLNADGTYTVSNTGVNYTITIPANKTFSMVIQAWGGGGGGGNTAGAKGGGGGGGYRTNTYTVTASASVRTFIVRVGSGGSAGNDGNNSTYNYSGTVTAEGGNNGSNSTNGPNVGNGGGGGNGSPDGGNGGTRSSNSNNGGGGGSSGPSADDGAPGAVSAGGSGAPGNITDNTGAGGTGGSSTGTDATDGSFPGGGGGGKGNSSASSSGSGANGLVRIIVSGFLPIELVDFKAKTNEKSISLNWRTGEEKNVNFFAIERSKNGKDFKEIAQVKTGAASKEYNLVDEKPFYGTSYYRLKMAENDGSAVNYSKTVSVSMSTKGGIKVTPTLANDRITVDLPENLGEITLNVTDVSGRVIKSINTNSIQAAIDINDLARGMYLLVAQSGVDKFVERFVKQ